MTDEQSNPATPSGASDRGRAGVDEATHELSLLDRIDAGDREAMAELLTSYQPRLFAVCHRMVSDPERATDLVQDAFVKILRGLDTFDRRSKLSTWMIRVTMNVCLSWLRAEKHRRHASLEAPATPNSPGTSRRDRLVDQAQQHGDAVEPDAWAGVQRGVERRESAALITSALSSIPSEHRAILVLRDVQGLEYQQIAEVLGVATGTVKSRLFRARAALRTRVEALQKPSDSEADPDD